MTEFLLLYHLIDKREVGGPAIPLVPMTASTYSPAAVSGLRHRLHVTRVRINPAAAPYFDPDCTWSVLSGRDRSLKPPSGKSVWLSEPASHPPYN